MADRDWYTRNVARGWRGAARQIENGDTLQHIGDLAIGALAKALREAGGVAGLDQFIHIVEQHTDRTTTPREALDLIRRVVLQSGGGDFTKIASYAANQLIAEQDRGLSCGNVGHELRRRLIERSLENRLFAPSRPRTVGTTGRFKTDQEARDWQKELVRTHSKRIDGLARSLRNHPDGIGLKAPPRETRRQSTADLIGVPVG
jgi:hypothetical protein